MAFSTFRGMMGAGGSSGPAPLTDTLTPQTSKIADDLSGGVHYYSTGLTIGMNYGGSIIGLAYTGVQSNTSAANSFIIPATQASPGPSPSFGTHTTFLAPPVRFAVSQGNANFPVFVITPGTLTLYGYQFSLIAGSASLSSTTNHTLAANGDTVSAALLSFPEHLVAIGNTTGGGSRILLFNQSTPSWDADVAGPTLGSNFQMYVIGLSSTLGCLLYTSANVFEIATVGVSGTTPTVTSGFSSGVTINSNSDVKGIAISSSQILVVYSKTNLFCARVVDVSSGSVTYHTEYTVSAPNISTERMGIPGYINTNEYACAFNANGSGYTVLMKVSGTTISFNTPAIFHQGNNVTTVDSGFGTSSITPSTTGASPGKLGLTYHVLNPSTGSQDLKQMCGRFMYMDYNLSAFTWGTTWNGNAQTSGIPSYGVGNTYGDNSLLCSDRVLAVNANNSTSIGLYTTNFDYNAAYSNTQGTAITTTAASQNAVLARLTQSGSTTRHLLAYQDSSTTVKALVVSTTADGTISTGTAATVDSGASISQYGQVTCINYDVDKSLVLCGHSNNGVYATIVTTSGTTIASTSTPFNIYTAASTSFFSVGYHVIDANNILLVMEFNGSTNGIAAILNISGTTLTLGTPVNVGTNIPSNVMGVTVLTAGRGIISYVNDAGAGSQDLWAVPFTYSGTTITLGSTPVKVSAYGVSSVNTYHSNRPVIVALNSTEALACVWLSNTLYVYLLTSTSISSLTVNATSAAIGSTAGGGTGFLEADISRREICVAGNRFGFVYPQ